VVGFGFVSSLGKYKVLNLTSGGGTQHICEVFTVGMDNSWRMGQTPPLSINSYGHTPYVNGNLHKLTQRNDKGGNSKILIFNLEKETWTMMRLPGHPRISWSSIYGWHTELREIRGLLCFTCCIENNTIDIWMLREYENEVWSMDFVINMTIPRVMPNGMKFWIREYYGCFPLDFMADGRILLEMDNFMGERWFYDPQDGSVQLAGHRGGYSTLYVENLVPISGF
jgi:F-box interacting protein